MKYEIEKTRMSEPVEPEIQEITVRTDNFTILIDDYHVHVWNKMSTCKQIFDVSCRSDGTVRVMQGEVIK